MKYLIVSDIHGSLPALERVLSHFDELHCDMLLILGDILNYGPRNGLPEGLNAPAIAERLNARKHRIVAVRGNCDSEVDQMLLEFPMLSDYALVVDNGVRLLLTHGHIVPQKPQTFLNADVVFTGHTHLWTLFEENGVLFCNTGSPTFPKGGNVPTFAVYENGEVGIFSLDGELLSNKKVLLPLQK